ncbi:MAG TPA: hypothetical protein PKW18_11030 [Candidatus Sumerlaeota bacterium]|nr:hypothetical protein [Candidatus Sumerlaeota bacterium]HRR31429.1 hypothetical protein [Candidatus Sumerlaeia bacterium]HON49815.1 hypothetical protein [Candidatus Sumerlaeota bacterium]HOR63937.1 hypothetical protein [Candidatus Sumerlaeota bacterium]HPL75085.1 hypothetical protein [Candidatus Sumerlaeota bacterium]
MNLSKREKMLGITIVVIIAGWLIGRYGAYEIYQSLSTRAAELASARETYQEYAEKMKQKTEIEKAYDEIVGKDKLAASTSSEEADPSKEFSVFVSELCRRLGFAYPSIDKHKTEPIEGVNDYSFITLPVNTSGEMQSIAKLLKGFDKEAVLIRSLHLRSRLDNPIMDVTITAAKIVQEKPKAQTKKRTTRKSSAAPSSPYKTLTPRVSANPDEIMPTQISEGADNE